MTHGGPTVFPLISRPSVYTDDYTVAVKSLHSPVKMTGFCDAKINSVRSFSTLEVYKCFKEIKKNK